MFNRKWIFIALLALCRFAAAQSSDHSPEAVRKLVRDYRQANEAQIVRDYARLLSLPNVASDTANIRANAAYIIELLKQRGFTAQTLEVAGGPPAVYGELKSPGAKHTLLWYVH